MVERPRARLRLRFEQREKINAIDLSALIFDLNKLYVTAYRQLSGRRIGDRATQGGPPFGRDAFRLPERGQLQVYRVRFESPGLLEVATVVGIGVAAIWGAVQAIEKARLWPLTRRKLELEIEKLEREASVAKDVPELTQNQLGRYLDAPETRSAMNQLKKNPLKPEDIRINIDD